MNVTRRIRDLLAGRFAQRNFGQNAAEQLCSDKLFMLLSFAQKITLCCGLVFGIPSVVFGQTNYTANESEYAIVGSLLGDQVFPDAAVTTNGGFVVWQDNITDGDGLGISAARLDSTLSLTTWKQRVNVQGTNDQENPHVALLRGGGAVFVWQGGSKESQRIYARFLSSSNTFLTTNDLLVNTFTNNAQINPVVATLTNGNVVVVWSSFDEAGSSSMQDVYGRIFSPTGQPITGEFLINQFTAYNQRTPTVAALSNGGFVVAWVSEQQRAVAAPSSSLRTPSQMVYPSVDIYARLYNGSGVAQSDEFLVNTNSNPCANPAMAVGSDGGFMVTWDEHDMTSVFGNSLDVYARSFASANPIGGGTVVRVNSYLYGDQYAPRISVLGTNYLVVWTSLGQDGSREGVYGQFLSGAGSKVGSEFRVNTTTVSSQIEPVVVSDGVSRFLAIWSSFTGLQYGFDLYAQRYSSSEAVLSAMDAPFVYAPFTLSTNETTVTNKGVVTVTNKVVYVPQLVVSWPALTNSGISVSNYEVYVDGTNRAVVTTNTWMMTASDGLTKSSTHSFQVDYVTTDGRRSPLSPSASGTTWSGLNWGGIPDEWMEEYYGDDQSGWPPASASVISGGPTLLQIFSSGGDPTDSSTWLQMKLENTSEGLFLTWNPQPGLTYQVQVTTDFVSWSNLSPPNDAPRFAAGNGDSIYVGKGSGGYYRVVLLR
jgi:hypothetical protein